MIAYSGIFQDTRMGGESETHQTSYISQYKFGLLNSMVIFVPSGQAKHNPLYTLILYVIYFYGYFIFFIRFI